MPTEPSAAIAATFSVPPVDLRQTLGPLRRSQNDPTTQIGLDGFWRATHTADGPATVHITAGERDHAEPGPTETVRAEAWGPGAQAFLDRVPALVGAADDPDALVPHHPVLAELIRAGPGRRRTATGTIVEILVPVILEQKVTGLEAWRAWRGLVRRYGSEAPGPDRVRLPPTAERLAALAYHDFHSLGIERRRAETILRVARHASRIERFTGTDPATARRLLEEIPGVGAWSSTWTTGITFGDPDAVILADFHLPHLVAFALTGRRRSSDREMLELLDPYAGQRARAQALLASVGGPARRAPRLAPRDIVKS